MKHKAWVSIIGLVVVAMGVVLALSLFAQRSSPALATIVTSSESTTVIVPAPTPDLRINRVVRQGELTMLVLSLRNYCGEARNVNPDPQNKFVSVELVIGNQSNQVVTLDLRNVQIVTEDGSAYPLLQNGCAPAFAATAIPANGLTRGQLAFDIPINKTPKLLRYTLGDKAMIAGLRY